MLPYSHSEKMFREDKGCITYSAKLQTQLNDLNRRLGFTF